MTEAGAPATGFEIGRVLRRSLVVTRERWPTLLTLTFGLQWGAPRVLGLVVHSSYRSGSRDVAGFVLVVALTLANSLIFYISRAALMQCALQPTRESSPIAAVKSLVAVLPTLAPIWLAQEYATVWRLWSRWTDLGATLIRSAGANAILALVEGPILIEAAITLAAAAAFGVFTPVVIVERRNLVAALGRAGALLRGARWKFVAIFLLFGVAEIAVSAPQLALQIGRLGPHTIAMQITAWITSAASDGVSAFWAVVIAVAYEELRNVREGAPHNRLAEVFA